MIAKTCLLVTAAAAALSTGCSQILGFKEPTVGDDTPDTDAMCSPAACPFGCDPETNACREGKLWIFKTMGATLGNGFGGTDNPPAVRGGADGRCLATYGQKYTMRQCSSNNVHAILHISSTDSIPLMATKYIIPTNVGVYRADDEILVSNNWNDLTDPTKTLRVPASTATTDPAGAVWTGTNTSSTCRNWTSAMTSDTGTYGYTTRTEVSWLSEGVLPCDSLASLLCICWPGDP